MAQAAKIADGWMDTLERMRLGIEEMLVRNPVSALTVANHSKATMPANMGQLDERLLGLEKCLRRTEEDIRTADVEAQAEVATLQEWTGKMAQAHETLARAAARAV